MARTIGTVARVSGTTIWVQTLLKPIAACHVTVDETVYKASHISDSYGQLKLVLIGDGTPAVDDSVTVADTQEVETLFEFGPSVANTAALIALTIANRPHKQKRLVAAGGTYQYLDGISAGDQEPVDSDGDGDGFGNGHWVRVA